MKIKQGIAIALLGLSTAAVADEIKLDTDQQKVSYVLGYQAGAQMRQQNMNVDFDTLTKAIKDGLDGAAPRLTGEKAAAVMQKFQEDQRAQQAKIGEDNAKAGAAFLAENKAKPGVVTLENGLQYKIIKEGTGDTPKATDSVSVHYRGTLIDGKEFDSSYSRGEPTSFPVNRVIPGWTQVLQLMKEGAKWQAFIPSELAYGVQGAGSNIGPNATLIFDIELIKIN